ncbi:MAG: hypothetical protein AB2L24_09480 [Mangrovibacterium sp.]
MFGIDQISWGQFTWFILSALFLWYLPVMLWAWLKEKNRNQNALFEDDFPGPVLQETTAPVSVSSQDFPSGLIPLRLSEDLPLPVSFYEETGLDEGYPADDFLDPENPRLPKMLEQVQFQQ